MSAARLSVTIPDGARAVLVFLDDSTGDLTTKVVDQNASVLNIERDLLKHLNEAPRSTEWLQVLRAYCDQRLAVRARAKACESIVTPSPRFDWDMTSLVAMQAVQS